MSNLYKNPQIDAWVMVGAPGAGKSTLAKQIKKQKNAVVISGDDLSDELWEECGAKPNWVELSDRVLEEIESHAGESLVIDGTHCRTDYRQEILATLNSYGYSSVCAIVLDEPIELCLCRNAQRTRQVPEHTINVMHKELRLSLPNLPKEGFDKVLYYC